MDIAAAKAFIDKIIGDLPPGKSIRLSDLFLNPGFFAVMHAPNLESDELRDYMDWLIMTGVVVGLENLAPNAEVPIVSEEYPEWVRPQPIVSEEYPEWFRPQPIVSEEYPEWFRPQPIVSEEYPEWFRPQPIVSAEYPEWFRATQPTAAIGIPVISGSAMSSQYLVPPIIPLTAILSSPISIVAP